MGIWREPSDDGQSFIHGIRGKSSLWLLLKDFLDAYVNGKTYQLGSVGFILALLVLVGCFVLWLTGKGDFTLALIAALALAYLIG